MLPISQMSHHLRGLLWIWHEVTNVRQRKHSRKVWSSQYLRRPQKWRCLANKVVMVPMSQCGNKSPCQPDVLGLPVRRHPSIFLPLITKEWQFLGVGGSGGAVKFWHLRCPKAQPLGSMTLAMSPWDCRLYLLDVPAHSLSLLRTPWNESVSRNSSLSPETFGPWPPDLGKAESSLSVYFWFGGFPSPYFITNGHCGGLPDIVCWVSEWWMGEVDLQKHFFLFPIPLFHARHTHQP